MILTLYRAASTLGAPLIRLYLNRRMAQGKEDPVRFHERLGQSDTARPSGKLVWMHAASVGEALSLLPVIDRIRTSHSTWSVLVTTGTVTSARLMVERLPEGAIHQYVPVDRVAYVRRFLEHWKPNLAIWAESEFWPNMVIETRAAAVPMAVLNGRMSARSYAKWLKYPSMIKRILSSFRQVLAQSETDGERFHELGATHVETPGNIKYAMDALPFDETKFKQMQTAIGERPLWLAASTHPGEEAIAANVHKTLESEHANLLTIIAPRHPERGPAIGAELTAGGLCVALRSRGEDVTPDTQIYIADTMGEMGLFYRLAPIVFMGKSLASGGGQNPMEAAVLETAIVFGPDMNNFEDMALNLLDGGGAAQVAGAAALTTTLGALLDDDEKRTRMATAAKKVSEHHQGVLERVMTLLEPYFEKDVGGMP